MWDKPSYKNFHGASRKVRGRLQKCRRKPILVMATNEQWNSEGGNSGHIIIFVGASLLLGLIFGCLVGLLFRESQLQRLTQKVKRLSNLSASSRKYKRKKSDDYLPEEANVLWDGNLSDDEMSDDDEGVMGDLKVVICIRNDLKMGKGKMCAQTGHAVLGLFQRCERRNHAPLKFWLASGQRKVAVKIESEAEMFTLYTQATRHQIPAFIVHDAGRTQVASGTATVLAIGPASDEDLDKITGHLKLL